MNSVTEQILARAAEVFTTIWPLVERDRTSPYGEDELPAINIQRASSETQIYTNGLHRSLVTFEIEFIAAGVDWGSAVDAMHVNADTLLNNDNGINSLGRGLLCVATESASEESEFTAGRLTARYQIHVLTRPGNLSRAII